MRKNYKRTYEEPPHRPMEIHLQQNQDLRSLECSSVREANPTNESHQMSWLEKLVDNIDRDQDGFDKKNCGSGDAPFIKKDFYKRENYEERIYRNQGERDCEYAERRQKRDEEFGKINPMSKNKASKSGYSYASKYEKQSQLEKPVDLNESSGSIGRIRRRNKSAAQSKQVSFPSDSLHKKNYQASPYGISESSVTYNHYEQGNINGKHHLGASRPLSSSKNQQLYTKAYNDNYNSRYREGEEKKFYKNSSFKSFGNSRQSSNSKLYDDSNSETRHPAPQPKRQTTFLSKYQSGSAFTQYEHCRRTNTDFSEKGERRRDSLQNKEEDIKMDEMAKRLNRVLQSISQKSKKLTTTETTTQNKSLNREMPDRNIYKKDLSDYNSITELYRERQNNFHKQRELDRQLEQQKQKERQKLRKQSYEERRKLHQREQEQRKQRSREQEHQRSRQRYQELEKNSFEPGRKTETYKVQEFKVQDTSNRRGSTSLKYSYDEYIGEPQKNIMPNGVELYKSIPSSDSIKKNYLAPSQSNHKYQNMRKSLRNSKHVPKDIIIEQSSSEIASEISPRTDFLSREFRNIFDILDAERKGQLTKDNCAVEKIHEEVKYLFGGVLSKIRYKNEKYDLKEFSEQCMKISKDFVLSQLREIFSKGSHMKLDKLVSLRLHEKDVQSLRGATNPPSGGNESKRSSDCSEVVKKYEFVEQEIDEKTKNKVHWMSAEQRYAELMEMKNVSKSPYLSKEKFDSMSSTIKISEKFNSTLEKKDNPQSSKEIYPKNYPGEKQNTDIKVPNYSSIEAPRRDFEKLCENLNNKLNKYLTTMNSSTGQTTPKIGLEFNELHKHWNLRRG